MKLLGKGEKKVEYIELIYDLIFVYMVGKNNALIHNFENGFVNPGAFFGYAVCTLAIIQIWTFSTSYINMFGRNSARDHIFMFINMYLMYFIGQGTRMDWQAYQTQYHIAWGLILLNIGVQYFIEYKNHKDNAWNQKLIKRMGLTLFIEAAIVFVAAIPNQTLGAVLSCAAVICGLVLTGLSRKKSPGGQIDFNHLTERAMLFVVLTFGEMIIAVASYFAGDGKFEMNDFYFSLMAFLIVVGLFLSYGLVYDRLIDRNGNYDGVKYMAVHIFIIFFMNNITASLEFMREEEVAVLPKMLFLIASVIGYFVFLFSLKGYIKSCDKPSKSSIITMCAVTVVFAAAMILLREMMYVNILLTVLYVFGMFFMLLRAKRCNTAEGNESAVLK